MYLAALSTSLFKDHLHLPELRKKSYDVFVFQLNSMSGKYRIAKWPCFDKFVMHTFLLSKSHVKLLKLSKLMWVILVVLAYNLG